jgi:crotonobetainyl-CoA:carnitine CoA-transferase CaiB-like acyl-CoA transferase
MPYRFSSASCEPRGGAAHVGEHNTEVLADWLGLDEDRVAELRDSGALPSTPRPGSTR